MNVFEDCRSLSTINVNSENEYFISNEGVLYNHDKTELIQYPIGNSKNMLYNSKRNINNQNRIINKLL